MAILGNNIIVLMNNSAIAGTKSNEIQVDRDTIEIASATNQDWTHVLAGRKSWSLTVGWLVLANSDVEKLLIEDSVVTLKIQAGSTYLTGQAIMRTCNITATVGSLANGSFSFVGNGPLQ